MKVINDAEHLFAIWFVEPLKTLKSIPGGNGGFIAIATSCFLYERFAKAKLNSQNITANDENFIKQLADDFNTDIKPASLFWTIIRHGILHQGMPMQGSRKDKDLPPWRFNGNFRLPFELVNEQGFDELRIHPWLFTEKVLELCQGNILLLEQNKSFPWAGVIQ